MPRTKIISTSPITWQLDTDQLNEFKVSNVTINVDNASNFWRPDNTIGFYAKDSNSPTLGYEPYWTKFQIRAGYLLPDGVTEEVVTLFTGLLTDYVMDSSTKQAQLQIQGLEIMLINTKAESSGTPVTNELTGTGNGSTTVFTTLNPGVGDVTAVRVNGVTQVLGVDYTIAQTNVTTLGAQITFTVAPANTFPVRTDYYFWPQNKQFSDIVKLLLTAGGVPSGNQNVQSTFFSNSVINTFPFTSKTAYDTGTLSQLIDTEHSNQLEIDWTNGANMTLETWSQAMTGWTTVTGGNAGSAASDGTYLTLTSNSVGFSTVQVAHASTGNIGAWQFKFTFDSSMTTNDELIFCLSSVAPTGVGGLPASGGYLIFSIQAGSPAISISGSDGTNSGRTGTLSLGTSEHTVQVLFDGDNVLFYLDGALQFSFASTLSGTAPLTVMSFGLAKNGSGVKTAKFRSISHPAANGTGTWTSPIIDIGATPSVWGLSILDNNGGQTGSIVYATDASADNFSTHDGFVNVGAGNAPTSTLRRYLKIRATFSYSTTTSPRAVIQGDPYVNGITLTATTSSTAVLLANFAGQTAYDAIQSIGEYTNYEYGFNPDETFFFRARTSGASVLSMTQSDYISRISSMDSGYDRVYGIVRATYGAYVREITDAGNTPTSPVARVSNARYDISPDSNIQVAASADIATGIATTLFAYFFKTAPALPSRHKVFTANRFV